MVNFTEAGNKNNITVRTPLRTKVFRWVVARLLNWLFRIRVHGVENIPAGGYIVYANHLSWVDTPLLLTIWRFENSQMKRFS